ncbi:MAG TPA: flagellar hook protein FlgE [Nevskiaceae bacterium]|nr:flagellar hook protein FlgE [Nevskiaceae bacterium]
MSFRIALSGINAAASDLSVIGNNIANANTTGFKASRSEFADFFPVTAYGLSQNGIGSGVRVAQVAQQFDQGTVSFTNNALDLALSGEGFFTLSDGGSTVYSRSGAFGTDANGYVVNAANQRLQVYPPLASGSFDSSRLADLQLSTADSAPAATTRIGAVLNLPASATAPANAPFSATDPTTFTRVVPTTVYDALGAAHSANLYFIKGANPGEWTMQTQIDGVDVGTAQTLQFDGTGALTSPAGGNITLPAHSPANGAVPMALTLDLGGSTQYGESFGLNSLTQDGYTTGRMSGLEIGEDGVVSARFTNGQSRTLGQIALAAFANPQGLQQLGDASWGETYASGSVVRGVANSAQFGLIQSGALESSNVDLTEQLVNMITAQRSFQANAQMISTQDQITQTVINLR